MEYIALGCMSGTSLDGIDCSLVKSDGDSYVTDISNEFIPYSDGPVSYTHLTLPTTHDV